MVFGVGEGDGKIALRIFVNGGEGAAVKCAAAAGGADGEGDFAVELGFVGNGFDDRVVGRFCAGGESGNEHGGALGDGAGDEAVERRTFLGVEGGEASGGNLIGGAALEKRAGEGDDIALACDGEFTFDLGVECGALLGREFRETGGGVVGRIKLRGERGGRAGEGW